MRSVNAYCSATYFYSLCNKIKASFQISAFVLMKIYLIIWKSIMYSFIFFSFVSILTNQAIGRTKSNPIPTLIMPRGSYQRVSKHLMQCFPNILCFNKWQEISDSEKKIAES